MITARFLARVPDIQAESDLIVPLFGLSVNGFFLYQQDCIFFATAYYSVTARPISPEQVASGLIGRQRIEPLDVTRRRNQHRKEACAKTQRSYDQGWAQADLLSERATHQRPQRLDT